ncbi:MAG: hypothetical protein LBU04_04480 [Christensenellaceae bacterium]|jgi:hypothetical protein|nr:hypothetical protein [Christensenellaceae bacterium]
MGIEKRASSSADRGYVKNSIKAILLILLMLTLTVALFACSDSDTGVTGKYLPESESDTRTTDASELNTTIREGLSKTRSNIASATRQHVFSQYEIRVNQINTTITYEANYDTQRSEDSEILLKVFDNQNAKNSTFFYYVDGNLYYELNGVRNYIPEYNYGGTFPVFYSAIQIFDLGSYYFSDPDMFSSDDEFIKEEDDMGMDSFANYIRTILLSAEPSSLSSYASGANGQNIRISDVSLDNFKEAVNTFLGTFIGEYIGTKIDVLSQVLLGFKISDLSNIGVGIINAKAIEIAMRDGAVSDINLVFDGMQTDNINSFYLNAKYSIEYQYGNIVLSETDDPGKNALLFGDAEDQPNSYWRTRSGEMHYKGTLYIDLIGQEFDADFKAKLSFADNAVNQFVLDVREKTANVIENDEIYNKEILSLFYNYEGDQNLYVSLSGLMENYIGGGIALTELGFPKACISGLNVSKEMGYYLTVILDALSYDLSLADILNLVGGVNEITSRLDILLMKSRSDGSYYELTIDNEFLSTMLGSYSSKMLSYIATRLGLSDDTVDAIIETGIFDDLKILIGYDYISGEIRISLYNGDSRYFVLSVYNQKITQTSFVVNLPEDFEVSQYTPIVEAETLRVHTEGLLSMQGGVSTDLSQLMGLIIGDNSGVNSPFTFGITDKLYISADIWQENEIYNISASIWLNPVLRSGYVGGALQFTVDDIDPNEIPFIRIYTSKTDPDYFLIELKDVYFGRAELPRAVKYKALRSALFESFKEFRGSGNVFTGDNFNAIYTILNRDAVVEFNSEWISVRLAPYNVGGILYDPIYDMIGVANLNATVRTRISFLLPEDTDKLYALDESVYVLPKVDPLDDVVFPTMYEAKWHEYALVSFDGNEKHQFLLTFDGESANIIDGTYWYSPTAQLFGQNISYIMLISDHNNGTKRITAIAVDNLEFDPSVENPIPETIRVYYDNPEGVQTGEKAFVIENFPYSVKMIKERITGVEPIYYSIIIGQGSIAEAHFNIPIEILNRDFKVETFVNDVPIVETITIDPYDYAVKKMLDGNYNPLAIKNIVNLRFGSNKKGSTSTVFEEHTFNWQLSQAEEASISFHGGRFFVYDYYNAIKVALEVIITAKEIDYIQIIHIDGPNLQFEQAGEYTIDSIDIDSYIMPTQTTSSIQIRVYFKAQNASTSRRYRIIGNPPEDYDDTKKDLDCDGYYNVNNFSLDWVYDQADPNIISLDGATNTLTRSTNINTTIFNDALIGNQTITMRVRAPSRRVDVVADSILAYTTLNKNANGIIDLTQSLTGMVRPSAVGYGVIGSDTDANGSYIIANPLESSDRNRLPEMINLDMQFAGGTIRKSYAVTWINHPMLGGERNLEIQNMLADDTFVKLEGIIGSVNEKKQTITLIIHNTNGKYEALRIYNEDGSLLYYNTADELYEIQIDPYNANALPNGFTITYKVRDADGNEILVDENYTLSSNPGEFVAKPWTLNGDMVTNSTFSYEEAIYILTSEVPGSWEKGRLSQTIRLRVYIFDMEVLPLIIYGIRDNDEATDLIDTYSEESRRILERLSDSNLLIGVQYQRLGAGRSENTIPVIWDNVTDAIAILRGHTIATITLTGWIYYGTPLQQRVSKLLEINARNVDALAFNGSDELIDSGILSLEYAVSNGSGSISINITRPYALINVAGGRYQKNESGEKDNNILRNLVRELFTGMIASFTDGSYLYVDAVYKYADIENIDFDTFGYLSANPNSYSFEFDIAQLGLGSTNTAIKVIVTTEKDMLSSSQMTESVETFQENGQLIYPNTDDYYYLPNSITVTYGKSGSVVYNDVLWEYGIDGIINTDASGRQYITSENFFVGGDDITTKFIGRSFSVATMLEPQNERLILVIVFLSKNIGRVNYNATAALENTQYSITSGVMHVTNIYALGEFDPKKIPTNIVPIAQTLNTGFNYATADDQITFVGNWTPVAAYSIDGEFNIEQIMYRLRNMLPSDRELIATMRIIMYNGAQQDIQLYIRIDKLSSPQISRTDVKFNSENELNLSLYAGFFAGAYDLQKSTTITFASSAGTTVSHVFNADEITYSIKTIFDTWTSISSIPFDYRGHLLNTLEYGDKNSKLELNARLQDGLNIYLYVTISESVLDYVEIENFGFDQSNNLTPKTSYITDNYYIDPYNKNTFKLPQMVRAIFKNGSSIENLTINGEIQETSSPFNDGEFDPATYWANPNSYMIEYTYKFDLSAYDGVDAETQEYEISVIILDRRYAFNYSNLNASSVGYYDPFNFTIDNLPDANALLTEANEDDDKYTAYYDLFTPISTEIVWKFADSDILTNDKFTYKGFDLNITGNIFGNADGAVVSIRVYSTEWIYIGIVDSLKYLTVADNVNIANPTSNIINRIDFYSDHGAELREFRVAFRVGSGSNSSYRLLTFIPNDAHTLDDDITSTAMVYWNLVDSSDLDNSKIREVKFYNYYKTADNNIILDATRYTYSFTQVSYTDIDFGFGYGDKYSAILVLDPLNPIVPTRVKVKGIRVRDEEKNPTPEELGEVNIRFDSSIYDMPMGGGIKTVSGLVCTGVIPATEYPAEYYAIFSVNVYYLDRRPTNIARENIVGQNRTYTTLYSRTSSGVETYNFVIDPISYAYDATTGLYILPSTLRFTFENTYPEGDPRRAASVDMGIVFAVNNVKWKYPRIPLSGTGIGAYIKLYLETSPDSLFTLTKSGDSSDLAFKPNFSENGNTAGIAGLDEFFALRITVTDRHIISTSISTVVTDPLFGIEYHSSTVAIDPYSINFPQTVELTFNDAGGGRISRTFTNVKWVYNEEYLAQTDVISGLIGERGMQIMAEMQIYGSMLSVQFPIKSRNIDTTVLTDSGTETTQPIVGGTIYILKGIPASEQLPQHLYYNFEYRGNMEYAWVPLFWDAGIDSILDTSAIGQYTGVVATLGSINMNNIRFNVEIIDPVVYSLRPGNEQYRAGGFVYDNIVVAVSSDGSYYAGRETIVLPSIIFINDSNRYLTVFEIDFDVKADKKTAIFNCYYGFLGADASTMLRGTDGLTDRLYISFSVELNTYDSTVITGSSEYRFPDGADIKHFPLGQYILASEMPKIPAISQGIQSLELIWDLSSVNIYRAGIYAVIGYYKTTYGNDIAVNFTVVIDKAQVNDNQFIIDSSWTYRIYTGVEIPLNNPLSPYLTVGLFRREDGAMSSNIEYTFEYLSQGETVWTITQPVNVGTYYIRVRVNDYNYDITSTTSPVEFTIAQRSVDLTLVRFSLDGTEWVGTDGVLHVTYDGKAHNNVLISGLPTTDATFLYYVRYYRSGETASTIPINADNYYLVVEIPQGDGYNYVVTQGFILRADIVIDRHNITYIPTTVVTYSGKPYSTLPIAGINEDNISDFVLTFRFYDLSGNPLPSILDTGSYYYTLNIDGQTNYSSAQFGLDDGGYLIITIVRREIEIVLQSLESEYLTPITDLTLALSFRDVSTNETFVLADIIERDRVQLLNYIKVFVEGGISDKHIVNKYILTATYDIDNSMTNYYIFGVANAIYSIIANEAVLVNGRDELVNLLATLKSGVTYRYYLTPGYYGDIDINRVIRNNQDEYINASVKLIGAYDINTDSISGANIAVVFRSITVHSGAVSLDIIKIEARSISAGAPGVGVKIGNNASDVTISRSYFYRNTTLYQQFILGSTAIMSESEYSGILYINEGTTIEGHNSAVVLYGGSIVVNNAIITNNINGIVVYGNAPIVTGNDRESEQIVIIDSQFTYNKGPALYVMCKVRSVNTNYSINNNSFIGNVIAVKSYETVEVSLLTTQNYMHLNASNLQLLN